MHIDFKVSTSPFDDPIEKVACWQVGEGSREEALALINEMFDVVEAKVPELK